MIAVKIPYRVSLFGGGCDYPEYYIGRGAKVVSFAIDKYMNVVVSSRFEGGYRISYTETETVGRVEDIRHDFVRGVLQHRNVTEPLEVVTIGELPGGTGLGSSAAVAVGLLVAVTQYQGGYLYDMDTTAWEIERLLGYSPGLQDHIRCWSGRKGKIMFGENGRISRRIMEHLPLNHFILIYTGRKRQSEPILKQQKNAPNIEYLNEIQQITQKAINAIDWGEINRLGPLLHSSWKLKQHLADGINTPEIGEIYDLGRSLGATGGKICGAGGGGFMLFFHPGDELSRKLFIDRMELEGYRHLPFEVGEREVKVI